MGRSARAVDDGSGYLSERGIREVPSIQGENDDG